MAIDFLDFHARPTQATWLLIPTRRVRKAKCFPAVIEGEVPAHPRGTVCR